MLTNKRIAVLGTFFCAAACCAAAEAAPPMRYAWNVGDRLVYERRVRVEPLDGRAPVQRYTEQVQLCCLAGEPREKLILADVIRVVDSRPGPARGLLLHADSRGHRRFAHETLARIDGFDAVFELMPILPPALVQHETWLTEPDHFGRRWNCTPTADANLTRVECELADPTGVAAARGRTHRWIYTFDPATGVVTRAESEWRDETAGLRTLAVTRLHKTLKQQPEWCQQRVRESEHYLRTLRLEDRLLEQITTEPNRIERILPGFDRLWAEFVVQTPKRRGSPFRRMTETHQSWCATRLNLYRERAELARRWLGATAPHWSLQTPDGDTLRSEALRDRLVVECYWSVESLAGLRTFETLRQVLDAFPPDACHVVCLNIDADAQAGRRAAQLCGDGLTHVLAGRPVGGLPPRETPIIRVLDTDSKTLAIYFGWHPDLPAKVLSLR